MKSFPLFKFVFIIMMLTSCQKNNDSVEKNDLKTMNDVAYGTNPLQRMDVYLPSNRSVSSTKVLIMIHGGAWTSGDKSELNAYVDTMKRRLPGYAIFNINYRLYANGNNNFPTQENDVKAALDFIIDRSSEYSISKKIVLLGVSAGGHLALLQGYKYTSPVKAKAIISFFGPTDMTDMYNNPASPWVSSSNIAAIVGATPAQNPAVYTNSSPVNFVSPSSPPTLLLHGGLDPLVRSSQAIALQQKLQLAGVVNEYVFYPTEGHGWVGANLTNSFEKIQSFLDVNVQ